MLKDMKHLKCYTKKKIIKKIIDKKCDIMRTYRWTVFNSLNDPYSPYYLDTSGQPNKFDLFCEAFWKVRLLQMTHDECEAKMANIGIKKDIFNSYVKIFYVLYKKFFEYFYPGYTMVKNNQLSESDFKKNMNSVDISCLTYDRMKDWYERGLFYR